MSTKAPLSPLIGRHFIVAITGGIAAYKAAELVRLLIKQGAKVRVIMTQAATHFITPTTLQALSGNPVHTDLFDASQEAAMGHIALARWADAIVVAPASANSIAQLAHGEAGDLLSTVVLASAARLFLCPAMNQHMWAQPQVQANLRHCCTLGMQHIGPAEGEQACGDVGLGRLAEPEAIVAALIAEFSQSTLAGEHVVITAGPTQEAIDPVRYLSNHSSGKMGFALAQAARQAGAAVTLISGPCALTTPPGVTRVDVTTAMQMLEQVQQVLPATTIFIAAAAVADYRCAEIASQKIKKQSETLTLTLQRNPDILKTVAASATKPFCVGFAAETENVLANAKQKLETKQLDMIIANQVGDGLVFGADEAAVTVISATGQQALAQARKSQIAAQIMQAIAKQKGCTNDKNPIQDP